MMRYWRNGHTEGVPKHYAAFANERHIYFEEVFACDDFLCSDCQDAALDLVMSH